jgi:CheY-like chemotaxis protein
MEAETGEEGLRIAAAQRPDMILLDLDMVGMNGYEFLARAQETDELKGIPIVVATAMVMDETVRRRLTGAAGVLSKYDLNTEMLVTAIRAVVSDGDQRAA